MNERKPGREESRRLFFAIWPDETTRQAMWALSRQGQRRGGRAVAAEKLHLTLLFIGEADAAQQACLEAAAGRVCAPAFDMVLDEQGGFARSRVAWLGMSELPPALLQLHSRLQSALAAECGIEPEHRPYVPHVTLRRRARPFRRERLADPLSWPVRDFVLVASQLTPEGSRYEVLRRWPLLGNL